MSVEEILQKYFGCKNPMLKTRNLTGYIFDEPCYEYLSKSGVKAYDRLLDLLYDLEMLLGESFDADRWVREIDKIVGESNY